MRGGSGKFGGQKSGGRQRLPPAFRATFYGAEEDRTPDLLNAIQALSQLSYGPFELHHHQCGYLRE